MLQWKYGETESTVAIICGQHRGGEVSWFSQQAAEIRFLSTVSTEGWRSAADVEVFVVDSVRHKSHGVVELVASVQLQACTEYKSSRWTFYSERYVVCCATEIAFPSVCLSVCP